MHAVENKTNTRRSSSRQRGGGRTPAGHRSLAARFLDEFTERVDLNTRAYFAWVYTIRWLGFRLDVVVAMVLVATSFFSVALNEFTDSIGEERGLRFRGACARPGHRRCPCSSRTGAEKDGKVSSMANATVNTKRNHEK